jgi:hypothetical protein
MLQARRIAESCRPDLLRYKRYQIDGKRHRRDTGGRYGGFSYRMCGEQNSYERTIHMRKISLIAVAAGLIVAGVAAWAASTTQARVDAAPGPRVDSLQIMMNGKNLPAEEFVDHSLVFN